MTNVRRHLTEGSQREVSAANVATLTDHQAQMLALRIRSNATYVESTGILGKCVVQVPSRLYTK